MIIRAKRINNVGRYLGSLPANTPVVIGIPLENVTPQTLEQLGFPPTADVNLALLPPPSFGPTSRFNALGKEIVHHDQPLETVYRSVYTSWLDWHGQPHSGYANRAYQRHPRTFVPPPAIELRISATILGNRYIAADQLSCDPSAWDAIKHRINLFLEVFGQCEVLTSNLERLIQAPVRRLNWRLLPPGVRPFSQLQQEVQPIIDRARPEERPIITRRLEVINGHHPTFVAIGEAGFTGYVVFGFPAKSVFLFESIFFGNATYVFGEDWEQLSQLTKAEILDHNLAVERVIHRDGWSRDINRILA